MKKLKFTLIELLVVLTIIGILVTLLMPSLVNAREKTKRVVCKSNISQVYKTSLMYSSKNDGKWLPLFNNHQSSAFGQFETSQLQEFGAVRADEIQDEVSGKSLPEAAGSVLSCPSNNIEPHWYNSSTPHLIHNYAYYGGLSTWKNNTGEYDAELFTTRVSSTDNNAILISDITYKEWGNNVQEGSHGYFTNNHRRTNSLKSAGNNQAKGDGGVKWVTDKQLYFQHSWYQSKRRFYIGVNPDDVSFSPLAY